MCKKLDKKKLCQKEKKAVHARALTGLPEKNGARAAHGFPLILSPRKFSTIPNINKTFNVNSKNQKKKKRFYCSFPSTMCVFLNLNLTGLSFKHVHISVHLVCMSQSIGYDSQLLSHFA